MSYLDEMKKIEQSAFAELYLVETGEDTFYYTSFERTVTFQDNDYTPIPISRSGFTFDSELKSTRVKLETPLARPVTDYIANAPVIPTKVKITRVFVGNTTLFQVIFQGEIINVTFSDEGTASVDCESSSIIFRNKLPAIVHQAFCNNRLYDLVCGLNPANFKVPATITVSGNDLISGTFAGFANDHFTLGHVITAYGDYRLITNHVGNTITLQVAFDARLKTGASIEAFPGCDKAPGTCRTKFNNFVNFNGFPFIPTNNPVFWGVKE